LCERREELTNFRGSGFSPYDEEIAASNGKIHHAMLEILHEPAQERGK
jgi:hypothetical protein